LVDLNASVLTTLLACVCLVILVTVTSIERFLKQHRVACWTDLGAHPAAYAMGTWSFPEVKRPGRGFGHLPPSSAKVKERVELCLLLLFWAFVASSTVNFTFAFTTVTVSTDIVLQIVNTVSIKLFYCCRYMNMRISVKWHGDFNAG